MSKLDDLLKVMALLETKQDQSQEFWKIGEQYFIRTVTMHLTGRLKAFNDKELLVEDAAWVADDGRFYDALKEGEFNEIEPFVDEVIIGRGALIDATKWRHKLPRTQK